MHGADQIVPGMARGQFANPVFVTGQVINFEGKLDGEPGMIAPGLADLFHVFIQLIKAHPPIIKVIPAHGRVIREADLPEAELRRARGILRRLAHGVSAERRVHVIVSGPAHGDKIAEVGAGTRTTSPSAGRGSRF